MTKTNEYIYAIDYGTSNSLVSAVSPDGSIQNVPLEGDAFIMPSLMYFVSDTEHYNGEAAKKEYEANSYEGRFIRSIKKFLPDDKFRGTQIESRIYVIESLIGQYLRGLKLRADKALNTNAKKVLLGRPAAYHTDPKLDKLAQDRMWKAAKIAGFDQIEFYPEPLAAANEFPTDYKWQHLFVIDLGAGTSDFTWVEMGQQQDYKVHSLDAVSVAGDAFDGDIMQHGLSHHFGCQTEYRLPMSSNILKMPKSLVYSLRSPADICLLSKSNIQDFLLDVKKASLNEAGKKEIQNLEILIEDNLAFNFYQKIEQAKIQLSSGSDVNFQYSYPDLEVERNMQKNDFSEWSKDTVDKIEKKMLDCLQKSGVAKEKIDVVLITGGSSQIPQIKEKVAEHFSKAKIYRPENFLSVVNGLAKQAKKSFK